MLVAANDALVTIFENYSIFRMTFKKIFLLLFTTFQLKNGNSQQLFKITYGKLDSFKVTAAQFKAQKELIVPDGFHLDSAIAYFFIPDQTGIGEVEYRPYFDSTRFNKYISLLTPGSSIIFANIRLRSREGDIFQPHNLVSYLIR